MPKNGSLYRQALDLKNSGLTFKQIQEQLPDLKKSTFYTYCKNARSDSELETEPAPEPASEPVSEPAPAPARAKVSIRTKGPAVQVQDDFLQSQRPNLFGTDPGRGDARKDSLLDGLFSGPSSGSGKEAALDSIFGSDLYQPETLSQAPPKAKTESAVKGSSILGHGKSWWIGGSASKSKTKSEAQAQTPEKARDELQMESVQKIRLYLMHFPRLQDLHIVPRKKTKGNEGEPDTEKWLISLYTKKQEELDKTLDFIRFHVRNDINEETSLKMANNIVTTGSKIVEHILVAIGLKCQGLTQALMDDEDVNRCIREILIENSINTFNYGPKADLAIKLGMKILQTDSSNRIQATIERRAEESAAKFKHSENETQKPIPEDLQSKYDDL